MPKLLSGKLLKSRFFRRLAMLSSGTLLGQLILLASAPLLTRLYSPEAFGALAVFTALSGMLIMVAALRYEFGVPVVSEEEAPGLVMVSIMAGLLVALLLTILVWAFGERLAVAVEVPGLATLLWFLPPTVFVAGVAQTLSYWSIRRGTFRTNAVNRAILSSGQVAPQLAFGALAEAGRRAGGTALILGYCLGYLLQLLHLLWSLPKDELARLLAARRESLWALARRHWQYPAYSAPSTLLQGAAQMLPALFLAALYGPAMAGWFGLGQRLLGVPMRLLAQAASYVYLGELKHLSPEETGRLFRRTSLQFAGIGVAGMAPLLFAGPWLFALVFGEPWRPAGEIVRYLVPLYIVRFVVMPVSQTLNVYGRQDLHLVSAVVNGIALALSFGLGWWLQLQPFQTILLYSAGSGLAFVVYFLAAWHVVRTGTVRPEGKSLVAGE